MKLFMEIFTNTKVGLIGSFSSENYPKKLRMILENMLANIQCPDHPDFRRQLKRFHHRIAKNMPNRVDHFSMSDWNLFLSFFPLFLRLRLCCVCQRMFNIKMFALWSHGPRHQEGDTVKGRKNCVLISFAAQTSSETFPFLRLIFSELDSFSLVTFFFAPPK